MTDRWANILFFTLLITPVAVGEAMTWIRGGIEPIVYTAQAQEIEPVEVLIGVKIDWTHERIEKEIREVFFENPNTAVAVFKCESGGGILKAEVQSGHTLSYGREESFGPLQIHARDHEKTAQRLGYGDYKTNPASNIRLGKYIYEQRIARGGRAFQDWTCYTQDLWQKYL